MGFGIGLQEVQGKAWSSAQIYLHPGALRTTIGIASSSRPKGLDELRRRVRRQVDALEGIHEPGQVHRGRDHVQHRQARGQGGEGEYPAEERRRHGDCRCMQKRPARSGCAPDLWPHLGR